MTWLELQTGNVHVTICSVAAEDGDCKEAGSGGSANITADVGVHAAASKGHQITANQAASTIPQCHNQQKQSIKAMLGVHGR